MKHARSLITTGVLALLLSGAAIADDDNDRDRFGLGGNGWLELGSGLDATTHEPGAEADSAPDRGTYLGNLSANEYGTNSTSNPYSRAGSPYSPTSINNEFGRYGSPYSSQSATNPYATDAPKLYDSEGNYRGKLSTNPYDPESVSNPYGRYGSEFSPDSINNPYGAGNPYRADSPNNPYGKGLRIHADDDG